MSTPKEQAANAIASLPDTATWDDIQYTLYVTQKVFKGLAEADAGQGMPQEEVERMFGVEP